MAVAMSDGDRHQDALRGLSEARRATQPAQATSDRLRRVEPRSTYVIHLSRRGSIGSICIGPFTKLEAERVAATLAPTTVRHIEQIRTTVPPWALRADHTQL